MKESVLALYIPIIVLALPAWLIYTARILVPALRGEETLARYAFGIAGWAYCAAHLIETPKYLAIRLWPELVWLNHIWWLVGIAKLLLLLGAVMSCIGMAHAITGKAHVRPIVGLAMAAWGIGYLVVDWIT